VAAFTRKFSPALDSRKVILKEFRFKEEALDFLSSLDAVKSFSFDGEALEAVPDE